MSEPVKVCTAGQAHKVNILNILILVSTYYCYNDAYGQAHKVNIIIVTTLVSYDEYGARTR